jgi:hypothetical protein
MNNDDIIIGFIFEVAVEPKRYRKHHGHGLTIKSQTRVISEGNTIKNNILLDGQ